MQIRKDSRTMGRYRQAAGRAATGRRALACLLWGLACFVGLQGAYFLVTFCWPQFHDPEYYGKLARLQRRLAESPRGRPLILALGSSHVAMGLKAASLATSSAAASEMPQLFNFAINAGTPMVSLVCLRRLFAEGIRPDWVLVETCTLQLAADGPGAQYNSCLPAIFVQWHDLPLLGRYYARPDRLWREWVATQTLPWYHHRYYLLSYFSRHWLPREERLDLRWQHVDGWGWQWVPGHTEGYATNLRRLAATRDACGDTYRHYAISDVTRRTLLEIVATCRAQGTRVAFLRMPEAQVFQNWCPLEITRQADEFLDALRREQQIPIIDARNWVAEDGFSDGHHLTPDGADTFMKVLEREALRPMLQGTSP